MKTCRMLRSILLVLSSVLVSGHSLAAENFSPPRTADGSPDFNGIWQALGSANWNIEPHAADFPPLPQLGAWGSVPAGLGIVVGGEIPYTPEGRAKQQENKADWLASDPYVKCYMPGVPRANYTPFPFQIVQSPEHIIVAYEYRQRKSYCLHEST